MFISSSFFISSDVLFFIWTDREFDGKFFSIWNLWDRAAVNWECSYRLALPIGKYYDAVYLYQVDFCLNDRMYKVRLPLRKKFLTKRVRKIRKFPQELLAPKESNIFKTWLFFEIPRRTRGHPFLLNNFRN